MQDFKNVKFKGKFRSYQQRVLNNADLFLKDRKINIVAAPGSGKTILGLELIRRLNKAAIILSPTTTIRNQWGNRFQDAFLNEKESLDSYYSINLYEAKLINSITYQALYSAINKIEAKSNDEIINYSNVELFELIKEKNIKTICLDEAHHLQNEWQKALDKFIYQLDSDVTIISLTATPPYDASSQEWKRYETICGKIDDEIFVPELVKEKTLCPHQDYIIFNHPTVNELKLFKQFKENVYLAIDEIVKLEIMSCINSKINMVFQDNQEYLFDNFKYFIALYILLNYGSYNINRKLFKKLTNSKFIPALNIAYAEKAVEFLIKGELLQEEEKKQIILVLKNYGLINNKKINFDLNDKLKRNLISSVGKLKSIVKIVNKEYFSLNSDLRMLILTDYIKKEFVSSIGTEKQIDNISVISIFEEIRKSNQNLNIGCLSGSVVILHNDVINLFSNYGLEKDYYSSRRLNNTDYSLVDFKGDNKAKVNLISRLFENGMINVLIGTAALLGEGWDSPCINSLILASYVGSFVLSNQMRGRAIRIDKNNGLKTANIFHLVTIEPNYVFENNAIKRIIMRFKEDKNEIISHDLDTLARRFDCFVGPNYETGEIESGLDRITYIEKPFDRDNIENINQKMFEKAKKRDELFSTWKNSLNKNYKVYIATKVNERYKVPSFDYFNALGLSIGLVIHGICVQLVNNIVNNSLNMLIQTKYLFCLLIVLMMLVTLFLEIKLITFVIRSSSPYRLIKNLAKATLKAFQKLGLINDKASLMIVKDSLNVNIEVTLNNASIYDQNIFNDAIKELLSVMDNPRYIIIKRGAFNNLVYKYSFACPTMLGRDVKSVNVFNEYLNKYFGSFKIVYVHSINGRKLFLKARRKSFVYKNSKCISKKQKVSKFD